MNKIPLGWKETRLGDVCTRVNDIWSDRTKWYFDRYIGGDDFDPGEIRVRRSKPIKGNEEVIGYQFQWRFQPGDVLYVVKNPRLRKAGVVDFEGICSISSFVLRSDNSKLIQELLPFLFQTENFVFHACNNAHGSTNPFLNWKDIAKYKFLLPPIEEQKKMSFILWEIEKHIKKTENLIQVTEKLKKGLLQELLTKGTGHKEFKKTELGEIPVDWQIVSLGEICEERKDKAYPPYDKQKYISLEQMDSANLIQSIFKESQSVQSVTNNFLTGDLLYGKLRPKLDKAALASFDGICTAEILVIDSKPGTFNEYLLLHFKSTPFIEHNSDGAYGTKMPRTSFELLSKYKISLGSIEEQTMILAIISSLNKLENNCKKQIEHLTNIRKKLTNSFLSGELLITKEGMN